MDFINIKCTGQQVILANLLISHGQAHLFMFIFLQSKEDATLTIFTH